MMKRKSIRWFRTLLMAMVMIAVIAAGPMPIPPPASLAADLVPESAADVVDGPVGSQTTPTVTIAAEAPRQLIPSLGACTSRTHCAELQATDLEATADFGYDPTSAYDQKGVNTIRGFSAQAPDEMIDPFTGNLILRHLDLNLPGVGGLDLTLQRVYNSKIHRNYAARATGDPNRVGVGMLFVPPSPLGLGWNMHLGRIVGGVNTVPNELLAGPRYYEAADGAQYPFYTYVGADCEGENAACLVTKRYDNPYRLEANGPWYIATADGLNITFAHTAFDGSSIVHYATEIRDVNGNRIQIRYHDNNTIPGINNVQRDYFRHFIDSITDSAGRIINFGYSVVNAPDVVRLTSITAVGRTFRYDYTSTTPWGPIYAFLSSAQPPAGAPWRYGYDGLNNGDCADNADRWCELTDITYPAGGTIGYTFSDLTFFAQANAMSVRAVTQRVVGGRQIPAATWSYAYNRAANSNTTEHTVITRPDNSQEVYTFFGIGNRTYNPNGQAWKMGVLLQKRIRQGGALLQSESYDWVASSPISDELIGDYWIGFDNGVFLPRLRQTTVQRGSLTWTTTHTTFNEQNNTPRCTTEEGDGAPRYRISTYTYLTLQQSDYLFTFNQLPGLSGLSYAPFTDVQCNPAQSSNWTPQVEDEMANQQYDTEGHLTTSIKNDQITDYQYHADGNLRAEIIYQGLNRTQGACTAHSNYQYGVPRTTTFGATAPTCNGGVYSIQRTLNTDGSAASETNGENQTTEFEYDGLGRVSEIRPPGQAPMLIGFDGSAGAFNTNRRVDHGAYWIETRFDGFGRTVAQETSAGAITTQSHDAQNRVTFRSLPASSADISAGQVEGSTYTYDALGRVETVTHNNQTAIRYAYGANTHTVTITDQLNRVTVQTRRSFHQPDEYWLVQVQLPGESAEEAARYDYLVGGQLATVEYGAKQRTIEYNFAKQVRLVREPESGDTYYGYDAAGNLRCRHWTPLCTDLNFASPSADVRYSVDGLGRTTQIDYNSGGSVIFTYDNANNIETMTDLAGTHEFEYSATNRLQKRTSTTEGLSYVTEYGYDNRGNLTSITYPSGRTVTYTRDSGNRVSAMPGYVSSVQYHPNDAISRMVYVNGVVTTMSLDDRQRPDRLQAGTVLNLNYDFDAVDNLDRLVDNLNGNQTSDFTYDELDRLTDASGPWGTLHYDYNRAGDRIGETLTAAGDEARQTTYSYDSDGLLDNLSGGVTLDYTYDQKGNVRSRGNYSYQYNAENRIVSVSGPERYVTYTYDGFGNKVVTNQQGCQNSRVYIYDLEGARIAEYSLEGALLKEYVKLGRQTVAEYRYNPGSVSATELDFGQVEVSTTLTRSITITNNANLPITLEDISLNFPFGLGVDEPVVVPANSTFALPFVFRPFQRGQLTEQVETCTSSGLRLDVTLRGQGVAPQAEIFPPQIDLGDVPYGRPVSRTLTISNTGDAPLRITEWSPGDPALGILPTGAATLQPGEQQQVTLTFDSTQSCGGPFAGPVYLYSNNPGSVTLDVTAHVLALEVDARDMRFGPLDPGQTRTLNVTLRNRGVVPLTPQLSFDGGPHFSVANLPTNQLQPGASVEIPVTYTPTDKRWSPFGDHAMLQTGFQECPLACTASAHMIGNLGFGNLDVETVPQGGQMASVALLGDGDDAHVTSITTDTVRYAVRDAAGGWTAGSNPAADALRVRDPALVTGPNGRLTALWDDPSNPFEIKLRQRVPPGDWGEVCTLQGFRRGPDPIATDAAGNVWLAWLNRADFGLSLGPILSAGGVCQAEQPPAIVEPGFAWDSLYLASGPDGYLGLTVTEFERLRFLDVDLANATTNKETPLTTELNFGTNAAIAADRQNGWHLLWAEIAIGQSYTAPARYLHRSGDNQWGQPLTLMEGSEGAMGLQIAVDSVGGVHAAWSDLACAAPDQRKIYYATRPAFSNIWQVSDVSTPDYVGFEERLSLVLENDRLAAVWHGNDESLLGDLLYGLAETGVLVSGSGVLSTTITPAAGGNLAADDGHIAIEFPPGSVSAATEVVYTRHSQPSQSTGSLQFAGLSFTLEASDPGGPVTQFDPAFTLTLHYEDAQWQAAGLAQETDLNLYFWDGSQWQGVLPCDGCALDTAANTLTVRLDHLTEFALLGPPDPTIGQDQKLFMPLVGDGD